MFLFYTSMVVACMVNAGFASDLQGALGWLLAGGLSIILTLRELETW